MPFFNKLRLIVTALLLSSLGVAGLDPAGNVDVQYYSELSCLGPSSSTMTLTRGASQSADGCYYIGACVPATAAFKSFIVTRIAISLTNNNGKEAQCHVVTYSDTACASVISGASAAGPLYFATNYPTGCVNQLQGTTPITGAAFKLVCGITSQ